MFPHNSRESQEKTEIIAKIPFWGDTLSGYIVFNAFMAINASLYDKGINFIKLTLRDQGMRNNIFFKRFW